MRSKKSLIAPAHVPEVLGRAEHDRVAPAHVVGVGVERALHAHLDAVDVVVVAPATTASVIACVPPEREWNTTSR